MKCIVKRWFCWTLKSDLSTTPDCDLFINITVINLVATKASAKLDHRHLYNSTLDICALPWISSCSTLLNLNVQIFEKKRGKFFDLLRHSYFFALTGCRVTSKSKLARIGTFRFKNFFFLLNLWSHWQSLLAKLLAVSHPNYVTNTCHSFFGQHDPNKNNM
jgi:hypothetical protein